MLDITDINLLLSSSKSLVSVKLSLIYSHNKKSQGDKYGERAGLETGPNPVIHKTERFLFKYAFNEIVKYTGVPSF